jgi:hypothetical protein
MASQTNIVTSYPNTNVAPITLGLTPFFSTRIKLTGTTSMRVWAGLTSNAPSTSTTTFHSDTPGTAASVVAFRFSTNASDTHWQAIVGNGSAQAAAVSTGIAPISTAGVLLEISVDTSNIYFWINSTLVVTTALAATDVPANTVGLYPFLTWDNGSGTTATLSFSRLYWETAA